MIYEMTKVDGELFDEIREWASSREWTVEVGSVPNGLTNGNGRSAGTLIIVIDDARQAHLQPSGKRRDGTEVVDIVGLPTFARARLLHRPGREGWEMVTDSDIPFHHEWNSANFVRLIEDLVSV